MRSKCDHCKKIDHIKENCFEIVTWVVSIWIRKPLINVTMINWREDAFQQQKSHGTTLSQEQLDQHLALLVRENQVGSMINFISTVTRVRWITDTGVSKPKISNVTLI